MSTDGVIRAALLLVALGEEGAAEAFRHLSPREVQKVSAAMAALKNIERSAIDDAVCGFIEQAQTQTSLSLEADQYIRSVLNRALGEDKAGAIVDRILVGGDISGIEGLKWLDAPVVAELIKNEHPQIIATVLVHLDPQQASSVLASFTERTRNDALLRIATLDGIQPAALRELDKSLMELLSGDANLKRRALGGSRVAAEIITNLSNQHEESAIGNVRDYNDELAQKIVDEMFNFEKLTALDDRSIRLLLKEIDSQTLVVALKVAPPELREKFTANMSQRAAELFVEDMEARGPVRLSEVEFQQRRILQIARGLADGGEIVLGEKAGDAYI
ncbi:flagellar motor switch protein FliG [Paraburkholderia kirstenboschensis]|uniref:Flagellar motor switch protein FliG n=1 Tax=Paraburkholderia kirstenboschensis TaxID=1245436 RepID=A0ABZ0EAP6_9BURK|nr:flagellar motor switch protein FliG [Paraburkholderia kirstenboschensis]WOD13596.1 flagellar motor switch protein FliG [Paraburkholderia kirstenboschensis]